MVRLLIICGPTAIGKTDLGIFLAKKFNGEIISADSRQVYKNLDILTGKDINKNLELRIKNEELRIKNDDFSVGYRLKEDMPIWLVDVVDIDYSFNVGEYRKLAIEVIDDISSREKLPIVVGGTGLYIKSLITSLSFIDIPPNMKLRKQLSSLNKFQLQRKVIRLCPSRWKVMNYSDRNNPRRLIRAIEIAQQSQKFPQLRDPRRCISDSVGNSIGTKLKTQNHMLKLKIEKLLILGLRATYKELYRRIDDRVEKRLKEGALEEVQKLIEKKYPANFPSLTSTGYLPLREFLEGKTDLDTAVEKWKYQEHAYARRQMTWFKKMKDIHWFDISNNDCFGKIDDMVKKWYTLNEI